MRRFPPIGFSVIRLIPWLPVHKRKARLDGGTTSNDLMGEEHDCLLQIRPSCVHHPTRDAMLESTKYLTMKVGCDTYWAGLEYTTHQFIELADAVAVALPPLFSTGAQQHSASIHWMRRVLL